MRKIGIFFLFILSSCQDSTVSQLQYSDRSKLFLHQHLQTLRKNSFGKNLKKQWVNANFYFKTQWYPVSIRLKGNFPKHWSYDYPSFVLKSTQKVFFNLSPEINLIRLDDRGYFVEGLGNELAKKLGLFAIKYHYTLLKVNTNSLKPYFISERLTKNYLEKRFLRGSSLFILDSMAEKKTYGIPTLYNNIYVNKEKNNQNDFIPQLYKVLGNKYNYFSFKSFFNAIEKKNIKKIESFLNIDHYLKWITLQFFFGSQHPSVGDNMRWLFCQNTATFSPILYNIFLENRKENLQQIIMRFSKSDILLKALIKSNKNLEIIKMTLKELISYENFIRNYIDNYPSEIKASFTRTQKEEFNYYKKEILNRIKMIKEDWRL